MNLKKGRVSILALAFAAAACVITKNYLDPSAPKYAGDYASHPGAARRLPPEGPFRIVTFNISYSSHIDRALEALRGSEPLRDFDALALQEMDAPGVDQIARELGLRFVYFPSAVHPEKKHDFGCAILSPWPLDEPLKVLLPHKAFGTNMARAATVATVVRGKQRVRVYSIHLSGALAVSAASRREQVQTMIVNARASVEPVIIAGDFNAYGIGEEFTRAGFTWVTKDVGPTLRNAFFKFPYDHIFAKGLSEAPVSAQTGVVQDNRKASDHRPVWAVMDFDPSSDRPDNPSGKTIKAR
jgi:endonuclease/exonuclease/phosphatase family metal-dependent hydrolase